jgi:hypothetical protein
VISIPSLHGFRWHLARRVINSNKIMVAAEQVLQECMHIQKAPCGVGNTQGKQRIAASTVIHTAEVRMCLGRVSADEDGSKESRSFCL